MRNPFAILSRLRQKSLDRLRIGYVGQSPAKVCFRFVVPSVEPKLVAIEEQQRRLLWVALDGLAQPFQVQGMLGDIFAIQLARIELRRRPIGLSLDPNMN